MAGDPLLYSLMHARILLLSYFSSHITVNWTLYSLSITTINRGQQIPSISLRNDPQVLTEMQ